MLLRYKGYQGSVTFDRGRLVVRILHIEDTVTDEFDSASEAEGVFAALVDDYVSTCEQIGKTPSKPFSGTFNVRVTPGAHRQAAIAAAEAGVTLNAWVQAAIDARLANRSGPSVADLARLIVEGMSAPRYTSTRRTASAVRIAHHPGTLGLEQVEYFSSQTMVTERDVPTWANKKVAGHG